MHHMSLPVKSFGQLSELHVTYSQTFAYDNFQLMFFFL